MQHDHQNIVSLTRTRLLAKNTIYNLIGQIAPLLSALIAIPVLVRHLGVERFGLLGISWIVLGYFGLFDFGMGRVMTKMIAEKLGTQQKEEIAPIIWTGLAAMLLIGLATMILFYILSPTIVRAIKIPQSLFAESYRSFFILASIIPIVMSTAGLRAILEAYQMFGNVTLIQAIHGVLFYLAPLAVLPFSPYLPSIIFVLAGVRLGIFVLYIHVCWRHVTPMQSRPAFQKILLKPMLKFGSWISVSNIIGPVMVYFDRFFISVTLSVTAVAYYITPHEVISKATMITNAVVRVLFPAFSLSIGAEPQRAALIFSRGIRLLVFLFVPITLTVILFARWGITTWLGPEFADQGAPVLQWLAIGVMINAPARVAFALIQAAGRPDITAKIHMIETPLYIILLYLSVSQFGIVGAALAWTVRMFADAVLLIMYALKLLCHVVYFFRTTILFSVCLLAFGCLILFDEHFNSLLLYILFLISLMPALWFLLIQETERRSLLAFVGRWSERV
ncbi:flippase [candidate division KSB1 bacterium]|nr:flippase [candidate division KSB1 bacterium]RQW07184.1 MAG: flippase [candidate division KSB1 bacterium]